MKPHIDIQLQIDEILHRLQNIIEIEHVRGHQDTRKGRRLTWVEKLNVRADELATLERYHLTQKNRYPLMCIFLHPKFNYISTRSQYVHGYRR